MHYAAECLKASYGLAHGLARGLAYGLAGGADAPLNPYWKTLKLIDAFGHSQRPLAAIEVSPFQTGCGAKGRLGALASHPHLGGLIFSFTFPANDCGPLPGGGGGVGHGKRAQTRHFR